LPNIFQKRKERLQQPFFNSGAQIGALLAPLTVPFIAKAFGWEMSFIIIGGVGFIWMGFWVFLYHKPEKNPKVNASELAYIIRMMLLNIKYMKIMENR
jgi:ACS family hexuronate transporter-like MFS transporter